MPEPTTYTSPASEGGARRSTCRTMRARLARPGRSLTLMGPASPLAMCCLRYQEFSIWQEHWPRRGCSDPLAHVRSGSLSRPRIVRRTTEARTVQCTRPRVHPGDPAPLSQLAPALINYTADSTVGTVFRKRCNFSLHFGSEAPTPPLPRPPDRTCLFGRRNSSAQMLARFLAAALVGAGHALEAKWTPAADGGPARFSKRYRDAAGIDDSRWTGEDPQGSPSAAWFPQLLPDTPAGWALAIMAAAIMYALYQQQQPQANYARPSSNARAAQTSQQPSEASEAARAAFLKRFDAPGNVAAPQSRRCD